MIASIQCKHEESVYTPGILRHNSHLVADYLTASEWCVLHTCKVKGRFVEEKCLKADGQQASC